YETIRSNMQPTNPVQPGRHALPGTGVGRRYVPDVLRRTGPLWKLDRIPPIRLCMAATPWRRLPPIQHQRPLGVDRLRLDLGFQLFMGLGALSLWPLDLR